MQTFLAFGLLFFIVIGTGGYIILRQKILKRLLTKHSDILAPSCLYSDSLLGSKMLGSFSMDVFLYHFILYREYRGLKDKELSLIGRRAFFSMIFVYICVLLLFVLLIANFDEIVVVVNEYMARANALLNVRL